MLDALPEASFYGVFAFLALDNFLKLDMFLRVKLIFMPKKNWPNTPSYVRNVRPRCIHILTIMQIVLCAIACVMLLGGNSFLFMFFPILVALMVPFRLVILPRLHIWDEQELHEVSTSYISTSTMSHFL